MRRMLLVTLGRYLGQSGADNVMLYHKIITRSAVRALHSAGLHVFTWTVDDVERMRQLIALGVDGITTNRPDLFDQLA
jgi:glycerophosphoryl diester phosphodiesterase